MNNSIEKIFEDAIEKWRVNKGVGTVIVPKPFDDVIYIAQILHRFFNKSPTWACVSIFTNSWADRTKLIESLTHTTDEEINKEFKKHINSKRLKVLTSSFISNVNFNSQLVIYYKVNDFTSEHIRLLKETKFKLIIYNTTNDCIAKLNDVCPLLPVFRNPSELRTTLPVEETQLPIYMSESSEDYKLIKEYNDYISTSMNIFGSFENLNIARQGSSFGISSAQICLNIAQENGWSTNLDMSIGINREIDNLYNPNALKERANLTYDIIRKRTRLLASNKAKLETINNLVSGFRNKKILIINKFADFASEVTEYLNSHNDCDICANYHDKLEPKIMKDETGKYICYKSGNKKGQPKPFCAQAQKTINESLFNNNVVQCLSTNGAPDKGLKAFDVDIVIITSPQCETIKSYLYRLANVEFTNDEIVLYSLYCANTIEEKLIERKEIGVNHRIVNERQKQIIDTNNDDIIIVD